MKRKTFVLGSILIMLFSSITTINVNAENSSNYEYTNPFVINEDEIINIDEFKGYDYNNIKNHMNNNNNNLPSNIDLSKSNYFPPIGDQGEFGSCTSWASTYYQLTYEINKLENITLSKNYLTDLNSICSPMFSFNISSRGISSNGSLITTIYDVIKRHGMVFCNNLDAYNKDFSWITDSEILINAFNYKLNDVNEVCLYSSNITENDLNQIKKLLVDEKVITVSGVYGSNNREMGKTSIIDENGNVCKTNQNILYETVYDKENFKENGTHTMTIVGYDDNIWCDVNNNGIEDVGEKGAFKLANSWGEYSVSTNNGYVWVLYDALRSESIIPNYPKLSNNELFRVPCFSLNLYVQSELNQCYYGKNIFYTIDIIKQNTKLVGEVELNTTNRNQLKLSYSSKNTFKKSLPIEEVTLAEEILELPFEGPIIFDFTDDYNNCNSLEEINNIKWKVELSDTLEDNNYITDITYCLKDNLNNIVATYNYDIEDLDGTSTTKEIQLNLIKGDLNYDEEITQEDINILQSYLNDEEELSYLQKDLADINEDGDINTLDLFALLGLDTSSTQQILVDLTQLGTDIDLNFKINISSDKNFNYTLSYNDLETYEQNSNQKILNILYIENADYQIDLYDGTNYICTINNLDDFINSLGKSDTGTKYFESIGYELNYFPSNGNTYANIILNTYLNGDIDTNGQIQSNDLLKLKRYLLGMYNFIQTGAEDSVLINNEYGNKCNNITINGNLTANGYLKLNSYNGNVNGELNANTFSISEGINHKEVGNDTSSFNSLILTDEEITELYFDVSNNITDNNIINDNIIIDNNLNYESTSKYGDILTIGNYNTQSITINSSIKSNTDIEITGNVKNSHDSIIYSSQGNIIINADNINFNGILYAPNGSVIITGKNVSICGTIIANKIAINSSNVNFNIQSYEDDNHNTLNPIEKLLADINNDKLINIIDLLKLKKYLLGLIEKQKCTLK